MHKQKRSKWVKEKRQNYVLGEKEIFKKKANGTTHKDKRISIN